MSQEYSREQILIDLQSTDTERICNALLGIAFCEPDWQWAQNIFLELLENDHPDIKRLSATCLGHTARIHGKLNKTKVITALKNIYTTHVFISVVVS